MIIFQPNLHTFKSTASHVAPRTCTHTLSSSLCFFYHQVSALPCPPHETRSRIFRSSSSCTGITQGARGKKAQQRNSKDNKPLWSPKQSPRDTQRRCSFLSPSCLLRNTGTTVCFTAYSGRLIAVVQRGDRIGLVTVRLSCNFTALQTRRQSLTVDPRGTSLLPVTRAGALFSLLGFVSPADGCRKER